MSSGANDDDDDDDVHGTLIRDGRDLSRQIVEQCARRTSLSGRSGTVACIPSPSHPHCNHHQDAFPAGAHSLTHFCPSGRMGSHVYCCPHACPGVLEFSGRIHNYPFPLHNVSSYCTSIDYHSPSHLILLRHSIQTQHSGAKSIVPPVSLCLYECDSHSVHSTSSLNSPHDSGGNITTSATNCSNTCGYI